MASSASSRLAEARADYEELDRELILDATRDGEPEAKELVELLISRHANFNVKDEDEYSPLHRVCEHEKLDLDLIRLVATRTGIDVNGRCKYGSTALHELLNWHIYAMRNDEPDPDAVLAVRDEAVRLLVSYGADINARGHRGCTPLMELCSSLRSEDVWEDIENPFRYLLSCGADVTPKDKEGYTALHDLIRFGGPGSDTLVKLLVDNGADVNARDNRGRTALHGANLTDSVDYLIAKGLDVDSVDNKGRKAITFALWECENGHVTAHLMQLTTDWHTNLLLGAKPRRDQTAEEDLAEHMSYTMTDAVRDYLLGREGPIRPAYRTFARWATSTAAGTEAIRRAKEGALERWGRPLPDMSRAEQVSLLEDDAWERRKLLVCRYFEERRLRREGPVKKPKDDKSEA